MYAIIGLIIGIGMGLWFQPTVPVAVQPYLPIAVVAAMDALFGALRARLDDVYDDRVFVTSLVFNVLIAALIVWLGDKLGVGSQLQTAIIVVLGIRIFANAASIRRHVFKA
ncbi:MAG: small basic family protein [Bowdeniella nasicola]|nr:small basic family protein [Bowdeniella nasicola]